MLLLPGNGVEADLGGGCGGGRIKRKRGERRGRGEARSNTITSVEPGADGRQPVVAFFHNSPLTNNYSFIHSFHNPQTIHSIPKIHQPINQSSAQVDINSIQFIPCCCNQSHFSSWKLLAANHSKFHYRIYNTTPTKLIIFILRRRRRRKNKKQRERDEQRLVR